jgi:hypothetical protein
LKFRNRSQPHQAASQIILYIAIALLAIALSTIAVIHIHSGSIWEPPNYTSICHRDDKYPDPHRLKFYPIKVMVQPWRGEHHVYAIFAVPMQYQHIYYRSFMQVKGIDTKWNVTIAKPHLYGVTAPEGHFLLVGFVYTRLALLHLITGRFGELKLPCNWHLSIWVNQTN